MAPAIGGGVGAALLVAVVLAIFLIRRKRPIPRSPSAISWPEEEDDHVLSLNGVEGDPGSSIIPNFPNDTVPRPYILEVAHLTSSEPSQTQSHRPSTRKPTGSRSASLVQDQMSLPGDNVSSPTTPPTSTRTSDPSEPSSRVIIHTDGGLIMNARQSEEVVELPPRYHTIS